EHISIASVDDAAVRKLVAEELPAERRIVVALAAPPEPHRVLPDAARAEPGSRHEWGTLVARHAHDRDVGVQPVEVGRDERAEERGDPDDGGVPAGLGGGRHRLAPQALMPAGAWVAARPAVAGPSRCRARTAATPRRSASVAGRSGRLGTPLPIPSIAQAPLRAGRKWTTS